MLDLRTLAPGQISKITGEPWCTACQQRWARCVSCRQTRPVRGGTTSEPLCATCLRPDPAFWRNCPGCGQAGRIHRAAAPAAVDRRVRDLLGDEAGEIRPELQALYQALAGQNARTPRLSWLAGAPSRQILQSLGTAKPSPTTCSTGCPPASRSSICAASWSPSGRWRRVMSRWPGWSDGSPRPSRPPRPRRAATAAPLRHLASAPAAPPPHQREETTHNQAVAVRQHVRAATVLLDWLNARNLNLVTAGKETSRTG